MIIVGRCLEKESSFDEQHIRVYTVYGFKVIDVLKGSNRRIGKIERIRLIGGEAEGRIVAVAGMPSFAKGDTTLLFLTERFPGGYRSLVGLIQGVFRLSREKSTGGYIVRARVDQGRFWDRKLQSETLEYTVPYPMRLETLVGKVKAEVLKQREDSSREPKRRR